MMTPPILLHAQQMKRSPWQDCVCEYLDHRLRSCTDCESQCSCSGLIIVVGRSAHAYTVSAEAPLISRLPAMVLTFSSLAIMPAHLLCKSVFALL